MQSLIRSLELKWSEEVAQSLMLHWEFCLRQKWETSFVKTKTQLGNILKINKSAYARKTLFAKALSFSHFTCLSKENFPFTLCQLLNASKES